MNDALKTLAAAIQVLAVFLVAAAGRAYRGKVVRQIATCKRCKVSRSRQVVVVYIPRSDPTDRQPFGSPPRDVGAYLMDGRHESHEPTMACDCHADRRPHYRAVKGTFSATVKCNGKCTGSKGHVCECECGGKNHGAGHA